MGVVDVAAVGGGILRTSEREHDAYVSVNVGEGGTRRKEDTHRARPFMALRRCSNAWM